MYVGRGSVVKAVFKTLKYRQVHAIATSGECRNIIELSAVCICMCVSIYVYLTLPYRGLQTYIHTFFLQGLALRCPLCSRLFNIGRVAISVLIISVKTVYMYVCIYVELY